MSTPHTDLDLADAQLLGFGQASRNPDSIIELVESMGLKKQEWEMIKERSSLYLKPLDVNAIDNYFNS